MGSSSRGFPALLTAALLLKAVLLVVLMWTADHEPTGDPRYLAPREGEANDVVWVLARGFDANAYQRLARSGYYDTFSRNYPLGYPLAIRAVDLVVGNAQVAAVLVSNAMSILAVGLGFLVARRYARRRGVAPDGAVLLLAAMPGVLTYGTVAYSESTFIVCSLLGWLAYLRAEDGPAAEDGAAPVARDPAAPRSLGWLALASLGLAASGYVRHLGAPTMLALGLIEGARVLRGPTPRGRAITEAAAALWAGLPLAGYFLWKFSSHDLEGLQEDIWQMRFAFLGGPASLVARVGVQNLALILLSLPLALFLLAKLRAVDGRLALVVLLTLVTALSFTGAAAQSFTRYTWSFWPLALGALAVKERGVVALYVGVLLLLSVWTGVGHVMGTAAL